MDLKRSDPQAVDKACQVLIAWQARAMTNSNRVHELIIRKAVTWPNLGTFDFTDLDICLRLVDRRQEDSEVFLSRIQNLVEDENTAPKDFRALFSHVETMLFFLMYAKMEDLQKTHLEFGKQFNRLDRTVIRFLQAAEQDYPPGGELVHLSDDRNLLNPAIVNIVMQEIRNAKAGRRDGLGIFREIFYQWALSMQKKFNLLVLPHHTQVICLLAFKHFLDAMGQQPQNGAVGAGRIARTLIAQVGTGEGKSMIVAALAIYIVVALGKKAHVVVDDETLLERDFWTFKPLFDTFQAQTKTGKRKLTTILCVSEERMAAAGSKSSCLAARVDTEADICYCEAKHVQSFYASIARSEKRDFDGYRNRVLVLDEVDALVIDEEPNEAFVYPNEELCSLATHVAEALKQKLPPHAVEVVRSSQHPAANRVVSIMTSEWDKASKLVLGEEIVFGKDIGKYCSLKSGRANTRAWSLALECRNFQDGFSREILFQERLFVMSRPRVFRKYFAIVGLSGSIGSNPEKKFLQETYGAAFFEVPPFLKTCRGEAVFHEACPTPFGTAKKEVYVEASVQEQMQRIADVVFEARDRVPVLIIGKDRAFCEQLVEFLHLAARTQGLGRIASDIIRSLSRTLYETDPEQFKENLNRATMPVGGAGGQEDGGGQGKSWRITVTDPRGGRGTDYRVDDPDVDTCGGLLLVPTVVPPSQRDWIQFLGRTARQDRRGQFCAVLCSADYQASMSKYGGSLGTGSMKTIEEILRWGDQDAVARVQACASLYNNGLRMNELCEEVFAKMPDVLREPSSRELLVDCCQRHRWMSVKEVDQAFARIPRLNPAAVPTEARDLGRPAEPPVSTQAGSIYTMSAGGPGGEAVRGSEPPRTVIFCLDSSASMMSRDTKTPYTRFEICVKSIRQILQNQVRDIDRVGVMTFGSTVTEIFPPMQKGPHRQQIEASVAGLRLDNRGGTCFYDAVVKCLRLLGQTDASGGRWLICLTDGDDLGSTRSNDRGQQVTSTLQAGGFTNLNMVMITVGALQAQNLQIIGSWVERVKAIGGTGQLLAEKDAGRIEMAFQVVAQILAAELGGAMEC